MKFLAQVVAVGLMGFGSVVVAEGDFVAEDQTPSGKFLTAGEVRPILEMTQGSWIGVREFNGQDLLYFTHLLAWRCGLHQISFGVNGEEKTVFPMVPCNPESPNAIPSEAVIYLDYPLGSIETIEVDLLFDDMQTSSVSYQRNAVMTP